MRTVAIAGGGPAGALCGERLARAGLDVTIYDERLAWEKPCGGGLTHKAILDYPFLLDAGHPYRRVHTVELVASDGHRARLDLEHPIVIYSRAVLNGLLLDRAASAGCRIVRARVTGVDAARRPRLTVAGAPAEFDFAVIAAGARNALLPGTRPLERADMEMTVGYFIPAQADSIRVKFLSRFEGYLWSFPRPDHLSVGICGHMARHTSRELRASLEQFLRDERIPAAGARFYSHVLPSPQARTLRHRRMAGSNWALVGDAAALVDPITGEGLYYALRSGELLAEALIEGCPAEYPARVRTAFAAELEFATRIARHVYRGRFLGGSVTTRMIQFIGRSRTFRRLMADLFAGTQNYTSLKRRLWSQFGLTVSDVMMSLFRAAATPAPRTAVDT